LELGGFEESLEFEVICNAYVPVTLRDFKRL
jgi:hypothetical protein